MCTFLTATVHELITFKTCKSPDTVTLPFFHPLVYCPIFLSIYDTTFSWSGTRTGLKVNETLGKTLNRSLESLCCLGTTCKEMKDGLKCRFCIV